MVRPKKQFQQLIEEIDRTPWGPQEQALVNEAVTLAMELGDEKLEYQARMRQTASANMNGTTDVMLSSFAWCLAHHDADPRRFPADIDNGGADLMWQFKWMASALRSSPAFSQEQIAAVLDDMDVHYQRAGLGQSGVLTARFEDAWDAGRFDDAEKLRVRLEATPRDEHSHCDACGRSQFAGFFADTDRDPEAIRLVEEMIEGGFSCGEEPEHALSRVLLPYLRAGRLDDAKAAHLRSYRLAKDNADNLRIVSNNIVFCAVTGNEARALAFVERHLPWLAHDGLNVDAHFVALGSFATALDRVTAVGHGDTPVRGADAPALVAFFGEHEGAWTAAELAAAAWAKAEEIGHAFDERDGTEGHAQQLRRLRGLGEAHWDVPIRSDVFVKDPVTTTPQTPEAWAERAMNAAQFGAQKDAQEALSRTEGVADPYLRAQLQAIRIAIAVDLGELDAAKAALPSRIAAMREAGRTAQADLEERLQLATFGDLDAADVLDRELAAAEGLPAWSRGDLALTRAQLHLRAEEPDKALNLVEQAARDFDADGDVRLINTTTLMAASALMLKGELDGARTVLDQLLEQDDLSAGHRAQAMQVRSRLKGGANEFASGAGDADEVCRILTEIGLSHALADAHHLAGALWEDAGEPEKASARFRLALRLVDAGSNDIVPLNFRLARTLLASGEADAAAELFAQVLQQEEEAEVAPGSRGITAMMLARALAASGEPGQAVGAHGYAADLFGEAGQGADQAVAMTAQARILARFGEQDDAIELLENALELVRRVPDAPGPLSEVLHELGQAYGGKRDDRAFALFDEVTALAQEHEADWLHADVTDSRARALATFERIEEAVATALTASDGFAALGDDGAAGGSELFAARILVGNGRDEDAVPIYRSVIEHGAQIPPLLQVAALELGDVFERLGRAEEAAAVRALAPS